MSGHTTAPRPPCDICLQLNDDKKDSFTFTDAAVVQCATGGCDVCEIFKTSIAHARPGFVDEISHKVTAKKKLGAPLELTWNVKGLPNTESVEIYSHADKPTAFSWAGVSSEVSADSSSEACFELIRGWINDCLTHHTDCPVDRFPRLPTRVVDVGPPSSTTTASPRLHISGPDERAEYLALSHCWGAPAKAAATIKTTAATLGAFQAEIPWAALSNTFRDAVTVTRRLGFRYLWIDSLCIIQGDARDWAVEAARMTAVYTGAFLVIAASGSRDGEGGCFFRGAEARSAAADGVLVVPCPGPPAADNSDRGSDKDPSSSSSSSAAALYVRRSQRGIYHTLAEMRGGEYPHGWRSALGQPLDGRAWTYQEEELAARLLLYTEDELQWRCSGANACECRGSRPLAAAAKRNLRLRLGRFAATATTTAAVSSATIATTMATMTAVSSATTATTAIPPDMAALALVATQPQPRQDDDVVAAWGLMVAEYTRRAITYATDRLPGLSGLAGCWEQAERDRYHAGLWERDLPRHMLWWSHVGGLGAPEGRGSLRHAAGYYAPTWSWASVTGAVQHQRDVGDVRVRVVDVQTEPAGPNRFGPVSRGNLVLAGLLVPVRLEPQAANPLYAVNIVKVFDARGDVDQAKADLGIIVPDVQTVEGQLEIDVGEDHWLLPIACKERFAHTNESTRIIVTGIVLRRARTSPRAFERVAFLTQAGSYPSWDRFTRGLAEREINIL